MPQHLRKSKSLHKPTSTDRISLLDKIVRKKILGLISIAVVVGLAVYFGLKFDFISFSQVENVLWDIRLRAGRSITPPDPRIKIIVIDQETLNLKAHEKEADAVETWPYPRQMYIPIIQFLNDAGAAGVAFDMLYTEDSNRGVDDDLEFANAIKKSKIPVVLAVTATNNTGSSSSLDLITKFSAQTDRFASETKYVEKYLQHRSISRYSGAITPIAELLSATDTLGIVNGDQDSDGVFRHGSPGAYIKDHGVLSLPFALYVKTVKLEQQDSIDSFLDSRGRFVTRFSGGRRTYKTYSYYQILKSFISVQSDEKPPIDPNEFKDSWVFFGVDAPALLDLRPIPLARDFAGVELNATMLDNLLHHSFVRSVSNGIVAAISVLLTLILVSGVLFIQRGRTSSLFAILVLVLFIYLTFVLADFGYWVPLGWPLLTMVGAAIAALGLQYEIEGRQKKFLRDAFKHYVSPSVIDKITADPTALSLGGERCELTIFFSDIVGFTSLSESIEPTRLVTLLNTFLTAMTDIILKNGGTVDKYVGDAIVAFWNAPLAIPDHAQRGVKAALECQTKIAELEDHFKSTYGVSIRMRIGIHTGVVSVGNFGSAERFNYTVIGDAANLASRLEGANKPFGTYTLISDTTKNLIGDSLRTRKVATIRVVGKAEPVSVYEPISSESSEVVLENLKKFEKALSHFENHQLEESLQAFGEIIRDPVARVYVSRIERDMVKITKGESWSPIWNLTEK